MRIESGTTSDRKLRLGIMLAMCLGFAGWFAYDGWYGWPAKNLNWALQAMPRRPAQPRVNSRLTRSQLAMVQPGMARERVLELLGEPLVEQPRQWTFVGPQTRAVVGLRDRHVTAVTTMPASAETDLTPSYRVTAEQVRRVAPGMGEDELRDLLGQPASIDEHRLWYVGPGVYANIELEDGKVKSPPVVHPATDPSEGDILLQKIIAAALAAASVAVAWRFIAALRLRVAVDDSGVAFGSKRIPWEDITGLDTGRYAEKGWVDLLCVGPRGPARLRLDSYHIEAFREILQTICERKGFTLPAPSSSADEAPA